MRIQVDISLSTKSHKLLLEVLRKRESSLLPYFAIDRTFSIDREQARNIQQILVDELCQTGLGTEDAPNERGLALEELIDRFSPL